MQHRRPFRKQASNASVRPQERRLDLAERNIYEALRSDDPRRRDAASMFTIPNSSPAGWITTSTSAAKLSVTADAPVRTLRSRWGNSDDDLRDAEAAEAERLLDAETVVSIE